jgi:hypothetical protein
MTFPFTQQDRAIARMCAQRMLPGMIYHGPDAVQSVAWLRQDFRQVALVLAGAAEGEVVASVGVVHDTKGRVSVATKCSGLLGRSPFPCGGIPYIMTADIALQDWIEESGSLSVANEEIGVQVDLACELAMRHRPDCRRHRQELRDRTGSSSAKDTFDGPSEVRSPYAGVRRYQDEVDEILHPCVGPVALTSLRIGMEFFRDVLSQVAER